MSVAFNCQNTQDPISGDEKNPLIKGKHVKDAKETLEEIVKDTTEAKAKMAAHLTKIMLEMKQANLGDPLKNLAQNPAWENFISSEPSNLKVTTKFDEMNMYMEIFKALNASSKSSNMDLLGACRQLLSNNNMASLIEKASDQSLADMQKTIRDNNAAYEAAQHHSIWDKIASVLTAVALALVVVAVAVAVAPETAGLGTVALIGAAAASSGIGGYFGFSKAYNHDDDNKMSEAQIRNQQASVDLSYKTTINQNAMGKIQLGQQIATTQEQNEQDNAESINATKKSIVQAMTSLTASN